MSLFNSEYSSAPKAQQAPTNSSSSLVPALTLKDVQNSVPAHLRTLITQELTDNLNQISTDPLIAENIRENFITYSIVLKEGKFKLEDYLNAVAYVSYKMMGYNNQDAYFRTFPARHAHLMSKGTSAKDISAYVAAYHKGKLVNLIMERSIIPAWVLNQDMYQKALSVQYDLMTTAVSEKVRTDAANSILTHLAKPKDTNVQINIGQVENSGMSEMRATLEGLARTQRQLIEDKEMKTIDIAGSKLIREE